MGFPLAFISWGWQEVDELWVVNSNLGLHWAYNSQNCTCTWQRAGAQGENEAGSPLDKAPASYDKIRSNTSLPPKLIFFRLHARWLTSSQAELANNPFSVAVNSPQGKCGALECKLATGPERNIVSGNSFHPERQLQIHMQSEELKNGSIMNATQPGLVGKRPCHTSLTQFLVRSQALSVTANWPAIYTFSPAHLIWINSAATSKGCFWGGSPWFYSQPCTSQWVGQWSEKKP